MFDTKGRIRSGRIKIQFFDVIDPPETWTGRQIVFKGFDLRRGSFGEGFDATVVKVPDVADDLMPRRRALREKSITDALYVAADQEAARDSARGG